VRRDGYAVSDGQIELIALSVAAPVRDATDEVVAAISVVVPAEGTDPRTLVPAVRAAARGISRVLGAPRAVRSAGDSSTA
jgi:DNA-binding IclR family transcriptional regulator